MLCDNLEGWDGVEGGSAKEGTHVYLWLIHVVRQKPPHCKAAVLQLKRKKEKIFMVFQYSFSFSMVLCLLCWINS